MRSQEVAWHSDFPKVTNPQLISKLSNMKMILPQPILNIATPALPSPAMYAGSRVEEAERNGRSVRPPLVRPSVRKMRSESVPSERQTEGGDGVR